MIGPGLRALAEKHDAIGEVRGLGVFWALDLVSDPERRTPLADAQQAKVAAACKQLGLMPFATANRIHLVPPCTTSEAEVREGLDILDRALKTGDELLGA